MLDAEEVGVVEEPPLFLPIPLFMSLAGEEQWGWYDFFYSSLYRISFPLLSLWCAITLSRDRPGRRAKGSDNVPPAD